MIQIRYGVISKAPKEASFVEGEKVFDLVERCLRQHYKDNYSKEISKYYVVVINGNIVHRDLWPTVVVLESDNVLIGPNLGDAQTVDSLVKVAIVAAVVFAAPAALGIAAGTAGAYVVAGVAGVVASLALNAMFPPPVDHVRGVSGDSPLSSSQMYGLTGQSNQLKRFQTVPKVYGTHRIFPNVAASPYSVLKGKKDQYFHAVYDLGLGPLNVGSIRIGDTPIEDFESAEYLLVDPNKAALGTYPGSKSVRSTFKYYKGDVEYNNDAQFSFAIDPKDSTPLSQYEATRTMSGNVQGALQEITIDFVAPNGLIAYGNSSGKTYTMNVEFQIEFSKEDENVWRSVTNPLYVSSSRVSGVVENKEIKREATLNVGSYTLLSTNTISTNEYTEIYGAPQGTNSIILEDGISTNSDLFLSSNGEHLGTIISSNTSGVPSGYRRYFLDTPFENDIRILARKVRPAINLGDYWGSQSPSVQTSYLDSKNVCYSITTRSNKFTFTGKTDSQVYASITFAPKEIAQYKVRVRRLSSSPDKKVVRDLIVWYASYTRFQRPFIITNKNHLFMEVRIKANNQLNGSLQNLSADVSSVLDVYDENTQTWSKQITSNPAWVLVDLLTGQVNKRPIDKSQLDMDSILEWKDFCDTVPSPAPIGQTFIEKRFSCNFVLDYDATLKQVIDQVTSAAQASLNIVDGKYGVLLDIQRTVPVQIFTPRNTMSFTATRSYTKVPDLLRIKYVDPTAAWQVNEAKVFNDGFNDSNYSTEDELTAFSCTNPEQAWRWGRYNLAQLKLRKEIITISVDFEHLVCSRGDYVQYTQDTMKAGGVAARVKTVAGNQITVDAPVPIIPMTNYAYIFRGANGVEPVDTLTVVDSTTFDLDGNIPEVGDLIVIGEVGKVVLDLLVKAITPQDDLTATLTLIEKADDVYLAETLDVIPDYQTIINQDAEGNTAPGPVEDLEVIANTWRVVSEAYQYYITLDWEIPSTGVADSYEIYVSVDDGDTFNLITLVKNTSYEYIVSPNNLDIEHIFKVVGVSSIGDKIALLDAPQVEATPENKITPPSDVPALFINITGEVIQLDWTKITDADVKEYMIRYSPQPDAVWEATTMTAKVDKFTDTLSIQARTGTYLIKAIDINGNQSVIAARAYTSVPELFGLNFIEETNDFPDLFGELVDVENYTGGLTITEAVIGDPEDVEYYPVGYYYYENLLDLGDIYTVRLTSQIEAEGFAAEDLMSNWITLEDVDALSNSAVGDWDVETQVRFTEAFNVMSEWAALSDIDPISEGNQDLWSTWTKISTSGDFTGRIFQYRLKLISNELNVTPRVFNGIIRADMPDRIDSYQDIVSNVGVTEVVFSTPFAGPGTNPSVQVTQDNMQQGDYFVYNEKTLSKVSLTFYDKDNNEVSRQFDLHVKGYGRKFNSAIFN